MKWSVSETIGDHLRNKLQQEREKNASVSFNLYTNTRTQTDRKTYIKNCNCVDGSIGGVISDSSIPNIVRNTFVKFSRSKSEVSHGLARLHTFLSSRQWS